jgi:hypothetical protein
MSKIQENFEGYMFVFPGNKKCEQADFHKGDKVVVSVHGKELRIRKAPVALSAKTELQEPGSTSEDVSHAA